MATAAGAAGGAGMNADAKESAMARMAAFIVLGVDAAWLLSILCSIFPPTSRKETDIGMVGAGSPSRR